MALLDIIGPIMVGPSSSHTAGAVRIGQMTRKLLNDRPVKGEILLHGSFATTGKGHGTDKALVAGILGFSTDQSMTAMEKTFTVMCETIDTYRSERMSASGLVGDEGGKLEKYRIQSVDKVEENGKQSPLCGNFMGEAMVIALKMAESNACMRRIVAAQRLVPVECYQRCNSILSHENGRKRGNCKSVVCGGGLPCIRRGTRLF